MQHYLSCFCGWTLLIFICCFMCYGGTLPVFEIRVLYCAHARYIGIAYSFSMSSALYKIVIC